MSIWNLWGQRVTLTTLATLLGTQRDGGSAAEVQLKLQLQCVSFAKRTIPKCDFKTKEKIIPLHRSS